MSFLNNIPNSNENFPQIGPSEFNISGDSASIQDKIADQQAILKAIEEERRSKIGLKGKVPSAKVPNPLSSELNPLAIDRGLKEKLEKTRQEQQAALDAWKKDKQPAIATSDAAIKRSNEGISTSEGEVSQLRQESETEFKSKTESEEAQNFSERDSEYISLLATVYSLERSQAEKALGYLKEISCIPSKENEQGPLVLQHQKNQRKVTFNPIEAADKCCRSWFNNCEDLSGIVNDVIVFTTNADLIHFIEFIKIISPEKGKALQESYDSLCNLKVYLKEECGLSYDMQDACALAAAAVAYPQAFGDTDRGNMTDNRAMVLINIRKFLTGAMAQKMAQQFPLKCRNLAKEYETRLGHAPCHGMYSGYYDGKNVNKYRPCIPLSMAISLGADAHWCINDEQPNYWPAFFPLGLHLVKPEDDTRDMRAWKSNFVFDKIVNPYS